MVYIEIECGMEGRGISEWAILIPNRIHKALLYRNFAELFRVILVRFFVRSCA